MSNIPVAENSRSTYENFVAQCPTCGKESVFNRASDLKTFEPIAGRDMLCLNSACEKLFRIVGDSVNAAYEMLIFECYELRYGKHYMNCILSLAQAYEVFFSLFLRVELVYKPFGADSMRDLDDLNLVATNLHDKIKGYSFAQIRALFLQQVVKYQSPKSVRAASAVVAGLPCHQVDPKDADIEGLSAPTLVPLLKAIKATKINSLRNQVVHKRAYRPTLQEVDYALEEARSILFQLGKYFDLHDEINWYLRTE